MVEIAVHFLECVGIHPQHSQHVIEDRVIQAAQAGQVKWKPAAVIAAEQHGGDAAALAGIALGDGEKAAQCSLTGFTISLDIALDHLNFTTPGIEHLIAGSVATAV